MPFLAEFQMDSTGERIQRLFPSRAHVPPILTRRNDPDKTLGPGETAHYLVFAAAFVKPAKYPIVSASLAVAPELIGEARKVLGCEFTPEGRAIITSRAHRLSVLRRYGGTELS